MAKLYKNAKFPQDPAPPGCQQMIIPLYYAPEPMTPPRHSEVDPIHAGLRLVPDDGVFPSLPNRPNLLAGESRLQD